MGPPSLAHVWSLSLGSFVGQKTQRNMGVKRLDSWCGGWGRRCGAAAQAHSRLGLPGAPSSHLSKIRWEQLPGDRLTLMGVQEYSA